MKTTPLASLGLALALLLGAALHAAPAKVKILILDGQNNHQWAVTTPLLKQILEDTGRFTVEVSTSPAAKPKPPGLPKNATAEQVAAQPGKLKAHAATVAEYESRAPAQWLAWRPKFSNYAAVIGNYNGETWPAEVRAAFETYVREGGGYVSYHAADNAFPDWPEYNTMIGVGGWGGRNEKSGPYLRLRTQGWIKDLTAGPGGGHGPQHEFLVESRAEHPIVRGLPAKWMHAKDELYHGLRGPAENVTVVASAMSSATKENEPVLMTIPYGKGRVFHTTLGHGVEAVNGLGFQVTFARGVEWAATGGVTLLPPKADALTADRPALNPLKAP